jgi:hypothetical protein
VFKKTALANYHTEKSDHVQFEESAEEVRARFVIIFIYASQTDAYLTAPRRSSRSRRRKRRKLQG